MSGTTDIWQTGIVHRTICDIMDNGLDGAAVTWLPEPGSFRFNADPFGLWHDGHFTVLVEYYDYRDKKGEIHFHSYDPDWRPVAAGLALREPHHLSYPGLIRDGGHIYMLPEAHRSGKLTLYRAERFPDRWRPVAAFDFPAVDASVTWHQGQWWMFYSVPGPDQAAMRDLYIAFADNLIGPWHQHASNPVRAAIDSARPGGTPFMHEGTLHLPVQDCSATYGGALNVLRIDELTADRFTASLTKQLTSEVADYPHGLHTLSAADNVTLIDVKRLDRGSRLWIDLERRWRRLTRRG